MTNKGYRKENKGITLVALVVTIVVLLILAGITITYVMGDNSIFKKASDAKLNNELAKIEERAHIIYADLLLQRVQNSSENKPTMQEIVNGLREEGDNVEQIAISENEITGISLNKEKMTLGFEKTNTIQVILEGNKEPYAYYAKVDGKFYQMHFNGGVVTIDRKESDIPDSEDSPAQNLTVSSDDETIATVRVDNDTNIITVTSTNKGGKVAITVACGEYTKLCNVFIAELEINSVRARIATGYTRWLTATVKPETTSRGLEWTSSNTEVATVDNKGVITTKKKGIATITVKTTDGSNLSETCKVTVDDAVEITTLTDFQTKNTIGKDVNGNLITVPGDFKVLTSEGTNVTQGIAIRDREGNEFVWVPVDSVSTGTSKPADDIRLGRYTFDKINGTPKKEQDAENYKDVVSIKPNGAVCDFQELTNDLGNMSAKKLGDFVTKTQTNGGYYIGRYEASEGEDGKADSKFDKTLWKSITQLDAATVAREMYDNSYVASDLINSYSWNTAIVFIQKYSENSNYANETSVNSSLLNAGKTGDKVCNIYDMASNAFEWTTEHATYTNGPCTGTGGSCYDTALYTNIRGYASTNHLRESISFRALLYIK